jgi:tetratricopeptide (TPR) repeat protein
MNTLIVLGVLTAAYIVYVRKLGHMPREFRLRSKGLELLISGNSTEAEKLFRESLAAVKDSPERVRTLVCLCDALSDQGRYKEAEEYLDEALEIGDPTGSGQASMADLLLATKTDPKRALEMAEESVNLSTGNSSATDPAVARTVSDDLARARCWARQAQAFTQLDQRTEARQAIDRAIRLAESAGSEEKTSPPAHRFQSWLVLGKRVTTGRNLVFAGTHWRIGVALVALADPARAAEHFRMARDTDQKGKYRQLAEQQLRALNAVVAS